MRTPDCPTHGCLVLDLALGRLEDEAAAEAEDARASCPVCSAWWRTELEGEPAARLDPVLESTFAAFEPPARQRVARWLPAAAAATLAAGAGLLWYQSQNAAVQPIVSQTAPTAVTLENFDGDRDGDGIVGMEDLGFVVRVEHSGGPIFADGLDGGDLADWTPHT